jgi:formylglycine-generating enzyme required for sulfatase activity
MVATVLSRAYDHPLELRPRPQAAFIWERSVKGRPPADFMRTGGPGGLRLLYRTRPLGRPPGLLPRERIAAMSRRLCRMSLPLVLAGFAAGLALSPAADPPRGKNYAFLVACQDYKAKDFKPLKFSRNDILRFSEALSASGFAKEDIVVLHEKQQDPDLLPEARKIRQQLKLLLAGLRSEDTLIVAFAGHGVQDRKDRRSYFCPRDVDLKDRTTLVALDEVYQELRDCRAKRKLLLVDACRKETLSEIGRRAVVDLESVTRPQTESVPEGIVALFSCGPGQESYEPPELEHGIFFHHVLKAWNGAEEAVNKKGQLTLGGFTGYVQEETKRYARLNLKAIQVPQVKNEFSDVWVLRDNTSASEAITNTIGMKLRLIPAGKFRMGSPKDEDGRGVNEQQHDVEITKSFYMGVYAVTRGQFRLFVQDERYHGGKKYQTEAEKAGSTYTWQNPGFAQTDDHPVGNVSWKEAVAFCGWLSQKEGKKYRLPTEAEWEYGCRAGTTTRFYFGDDVAQLKDYAWYRKNSDNRTHPVGEKKANAWNLYDIHGNVWQWCQDYYAENYYKDSPRQDPQGPDAGAFRVVRGGSFDSEPRDCRSANRIWSVPAYRLNDLGFRVVRVR